MIAKFAGQCIRCGEPIEKGTDVAYDPIARKVHHHDCEAANVERGDAGEVLAERLGYLPHADPRTIAGLK